MSSFPGRRLRRFLAAALLSLACACSQTFDATRLGVPVTMASPAKEPASGARFTVKGKAIYGFWGLWSISSPSLARTLSTQLVGGKWIADERIKVRSRLSDVILAGLTLGLVVPRTVTYEGVIVGEGEPGGPEE